MNITRPIASCLAVLSLAGTASAQVRLASATIPAARAVHASWVARIGTGGEGYGFLLRDARGLPADAPRPEHWEEPNLPGAIGIGFDTRDPKSDNPFDANGNIEGRPEREISLHWDGAEVANRLSNVEFRGGAHRVDVDVNYVTGGAEVSVRIDRVPVYNRYFVPNAVSVPARAEVGGAADAGALEVTGFSASGQGAALPPSAPVRIRAFDAALNNKDHQTLTNTVDFPAKTDGVGRILCTLTLGPTKDGVDPWDRMAAISLYDGAGRKFEILRYMTPYHRGYTWTADVTDYLPLLRGRKKMEVWCETWGAGWLVTVDFTFHHGPIVRVPYRVENLWTGTVNIGDAAHPVDRFFTPKRLPVDPGAKAMKLRFVVTGHGQAPNTGNAAEFIPLSRTVTVDGASYEDLLWKTDNYLNPCRPQGGTWKYDRAGWCPGALVTPWDIDITREASRARSAGRPIEVRYTLAPYTNKTPDPGNPARHWVTAQVIYYR